MPTNLVATITKVFTPELLARIASALGLDQAAVQKAVTAGVPGLLAALTSLVAKPGGAAKLSDTVAEQQPGILTSIANAIGGSGQKALIDTGLGALSSLLGGSTTSALTSAVSKFAGIGDGASKGLMGVLGPLVMGVLGQQQRASGLDASGMARLLESQKDNIANALPSGFAKYLSGTGILDGIAGPGEACGEGPKPLTDHRNRIGSCRCSGVLALGALGWYLLGRSPTETVATVPPSAMETPMQTPGRMTFTHRRTKQTAGSGRAAYSSDNKKIGEIVEINRGPDNKVRMVYVDTGTYLGIGATRYEVSVRQDSRGQAGWSRPDAQKVRGEDRAASGRATEAIEDFPPRRASFCAAVDTSDEPPDWRDRQVFKDRLIVAPHEN